MASITDCTKRWPSLMVVCALGAGRFRLGVVVVEDEAGGEEEHVVGGAGADERLKIAIGEGAAGGQIPVRLQRRRVGVGEVARIAAGGAVDEAIHLAAVDLV